MDISRVFIFIILTFLSGCSLLAPTYEIPALDLGENPEVLVQGCCNQGEMANYGTLDVGPFFEHWKHATWTNASKAIETSKGGRFYFVFGHGLVITFNTKYPIFQVQGREGYYLIRDDQKADYKEFQVQSNQTIMDNWYRLNEPNK